MEIPFLDTVKTRIDKSKTWVNVKYKQIFSAEYKYKGFAEFKKVFNPNTQSTDYFIVFENEKDNNNFKIRIDELGRTRISLSRLWNELNLNDRTKDFQIKLEYIETFNDCDIFKIVLD